MCVLLVLGRHYKYKYFSICHQKALSLVEAVQDMPCREMHCERFRRRLII